VIDGFDYYQSYLHIFSSYRIKYRGFIEKKDQKDDIPSYDIEKVKIIAMHFYKLS
jgi:hypothetical protein